MSENNVQSKKDILKDLNAVKTGGKFLTRVVGTNDVFCKESFSDEEKMILCRKRHLFQQLK